MNKRDKNGRFIKGFYPPKPFKKGNKLRIGVKLSSIIKEKIGRGNFKTGRIKMQGYIYVLSPRHPNAGFRKKGYIGNGYVAEHRLVMEKILGRYLKSNELVHHKNGIRDDNRSKNLAIVLRKTHFGKVNCPKCKYRFLIK